MAGLSSRCGDVLFQRHDFMRLWLQHFAADAELRLLTLRDAGGQLVAVLPLLASRQRMYGIPVREWQSAANLHSCRFDLLADDPLEAARCFVDFLRRRADWDLLRLMDVPGTGQARSLLLAAAQAGLAAGSWDSVQSPYVPLPSQWAELDTTLHSKFRANLRRRRRRLATQGTISLERFGGGPELASRLDEGLALEASGWKGEAGSAIRQDPQTDAFYRELAAESARNGRLALWFLRLDGRAIAFQYALEHDGRLLLLKPAYDQAFGDCSPGQLLMEDVLRDAIDRGLREFDFLGPDMPWKRDWTALRRPHQWFYLFRGARGTLLHALKFRIAPWLKRIRHRGSP
jgi:CelD/BcsL family acetyltransferase involved in cellulose biosynthesis